MQDSSQEKTTSDTLASGTYEVLRNRLRESASDLRERFVRLNEARAEVFGSIETKLLGTAHVTTDNNCIPRDLLTLGQDLVLAYNVNFGLRTEVTIKDVFSVYRLEGEVAHSKQLDEVFDERFERDFKELYRYYKNTTFSHFFSTQSFVYFVFRVGKSGGDFKSFKFELNGGSLKYVDNRSDQEVRLPEQHAFRWQRATRDQHRSGVHPHVSIEDLVFVECVGGDLTIKVEDNTEDGSGIYAEPVDNPDQTLDDAEVFYAIVGNLVMLKMRPYQEDAYRYFVFSTKRQTVTRLDALAKACVFLPDDQGIIFPGGLVLQTGDSKVFDHRLDRLVYVKTIAAPNGEDFLYLFSNLETGENLHLRYNLIKQEVDTPLICHGQAFSEDGTMVTFRSDEQAQKHHALQRWQTPFVGPNYKADIDVESTLYKIGNRDLVRGMAECQELLQLIDKDDSYAELYADLEKRATDIIDGYFWLDRPETMNFAEPIISIRDTANAAVEEFDKVVRVRRETEKALRTVSQATDELISNIGRSAFNTVTDFVSQLAEIRTQRGEAIGLKELKYIDLEQAESLEVQLAETAERLGHRCVDFLLQPKALEPYRERIAKAESAVGEVSGASAGKELQEQLGQIGDDLELLIETVSQLKIEDLTQRTAITDETGSLLADLNRVRSTLRARVRDLLSGEMEADFASQTKLLDQAATGALETADTPEKVDESLTRMMLQLEELEGRFAEFDELLIRLAEKREQLYEAFEARRQQLVEARSRRAEGLSAAADRILQGVRSRATRYEDAKELRSYFASDPMVDKVRQIAKQLEELGDSVRMEDVLSRLKTIADDSVRQQRDRKDLYVGGGDQIKLGKHLFSVNTQPVELTTVVREEKIQLHITGTQFYQPMHGPELDAAEDLWLQSLPSESDQVARAEFLAHRLSEEIASGEMQWPAEPELQIDFVREYMQSKHEEGYARGVHDRDAALILDKLLAMHRGLGLLRYGPSIRGRAWFAWRSLLPEQQQQDLANWVTGFSRMKKVLPTAEASAAYKRSLASALSAVAAEFFQDADSPVGVNVAAEYLFAQLKECKDSFVVSPQAQEIQRSLREHLPQDERKELAEAIRHPSKPLEAWTVAEDAVDAYLATRELNDELDPAQRYRDEVIGLLLNEHAEHYAGPSVSVAHSLEGLVSDHPRVRDSKLQLHFHEFSDRLRGYEETVVPRFYDLKRAKHDLIEEAEKSLRTSEFKPKVLTSFVRNQLLDEVYLPLIGDNLAKQMGASGDNKRTDRMGLLLLISPPGYGKTTLMEYVANRLGLVFVKVNGPALGHQVTSLDPEEAANASAREEVKRINLALEMGDNVMLYLDDIQHCNPELLQKFIPLCDATRRIEGVWNEQAKTYDLRGRKVSVVMAGNPYTESGERFQIPDMLSNRADVYNLGEIIGESRDAFEMSYIENCLTSNPVLQPLAKASSSDQRAVIKAAERGTLEGLSLESNVASDQLTEMISVLSKLLRVRDVVLNVNRTYIQSAAQADAYRTEPPFKLQGSYRNMNRIAEKVVPLMNDEELQRLIISAYEQDAQTLTRDSEANLLKFREILGDLDRDQEKRWEAIKYAFVESVRMQGIDGEDSAAQVLRSLSGLRDGLESIRRVIAESMGAITSDARTDQANQAVGKLSEALNDLGEQLGGSFKDAVQVGLDAVEQNPPEQKVLVQHSVPRVMTDLVESQYQLLYDGLRPVLEATTAGKEQMAALSDRIETCLAAYRSLKEEINNSAKS